MDRSERIAGGLIGLLVGDALGVPYEFHVPQSLPAAIEMTPPLSFRRSHHQVAPGTWSDDGSMALCLAASLLEHGALDLDDLGRRFQRWYDEGYLTVDGAFDIGNQTTEALDRLDAGVAARDAGGAGERDNGNGSLMRVLPLALWHRGDDDELVELAHDQSRVTHAHPRSMVACALYSLWARYELDGAAHSSARALERLRTLYGVGSYRDELERWYATPLEARGTGYVVDCFHSAALALEEPDYERIVTRAVRFGYDTDTTAAVAGGLAGVRFGLDGIPRRWRDALLGADIVAPILAGLCARG